MSTHLITFDLPAEVNPAPDSRILVFKTNLQSKRDVKILEPVLNLITGIKGWNVDLDDIDKVLRIKTEELQIRDIIELLNQAGYFCEELPD